jgi:predicted P-loop ATPase/GTPase
MANVTIDLEALRAEVSNISLDDARKQLLELRTRQRVQMKKYHDPEKAKAYRQRRSTFLKLLADKAKAAGIYDEILAEADEAADMVLAEGETAPEPTEA